MSTTTSTAARRLSAAMERTGHWVCSQEVQVPTDLIVDVGESSFPLHKFMLMAKSGYIRAKVLGSDRSGPTRVDLSDIPGGAEAFEKAVKFCYGVNFEITAHNVASIRCAAEYLEMTEMVCDGNLKARTEEFLAQAALKTLPGAAVVLKSCEGLGPFADEIGLVQRCVDVISLKTCNEVNFPSRSPANWWIADLTSLPASALGKSMISMKSRGASQKTLSAVITAYAEKSLPDFLRPIDSSLPLSDPPPAVRAHQLSHLESIVSLLKSTSVSLPVSFMCLLLRAAIFLNSPAESRRELERAVSSDLDRASVGDLLVVALDCSGERVADLDSVRRIVAGFVDKEGGGLYGGGTVACSAAVQAVARTVDAFACEIATDEGLGVSKFAGVAGALPKAARRFDDDLYRAVDIYLKAHPELDEIEREKVCSVIDPLRLSYEGRLHASQNKRLPLQVVLHALYYDQLKLRGGAADELATPQHSAAGTARGRADADVTLRRENEELRSELTRMKMHMSGLEKNKKVGKKPTFFASVSRTLGKLNPFRQGAKDTSSIDDGGVRVAVAKRNFPPCDLKYSEYTPCQDPVRARKLDKNMLKYRERHCPKKDELMMCLIPAPPKYKNPFKWPQSRDFAWFDNIPHRELSIEKAVQNWIQVEGNRFRFPGGGTMFPRGADAYIDDIDALIPLTKGNIRTAIDTGCGVASWGAFLLKRNILTMSFAPRDSHEAQVQFALERGVPAMIGVMSSERMPYPASSFDMAHCSRCLIPWYDYDGLYLIEVDRVLRPGGYWILSGPPIRWKKYYDGWERTKEDLKKEQDAIEDVAKRLCWKKIIEKGDLAIWQKPINHVECVQTRKVYKKPHICKGDNPDAAWYKNMETCITPLPEVSGPGEVAGGALENWPARAFAVPPRISRGTLPGVTAEKFQKDNKMWKERIAHYRKLIPPLTRGRYRNVMDMNAKLGGFAAALSQYPLWVMNAVPSDSERDTLGVIYERGFIGTYQDWCEAFSTYPRTYDLIHADGVFSIYQDRCDIAHILLEMDRILRPEGTVIFRDTVEVLVRVKGIADGIRWKSQIEDHESGPFNAEKILVAVKTYWTAEPAQNQ